MTFARPYVPASASILSTSSGGNLTGTIFMLSGGRPMRAAVSGNVALFKKTIPFCVDALNDTDYINGIEYERKHKELKMNAINAKVETLSVSKLIEMAKLLFADNRDGAEIVLSAVLDRLMAILPEDRFVALCAEIEA